MVSAVDMHLRQLEARLTRRGEPRESVERRVAQAKNELLVAQWPGLGLFDATVQNSMLSLAYPSFRSHVLEANPDYNHHRSQ
jgi:guanylate kinase